MVANIEIKNQKVLDILEYSRELFMNKWDVPSHNNLLGEFGRNPQDFVGPEYLQRILDLGERHTGTPYGALSYALKPDHYLGDDPQYVKDFQDYDYRIKSELGITQNALSQLYPPEGYIAWHNNADAPGYNLIFTWSETGDGWFKYIDSDGKEQTIYDTKGWSLKAGYFGTYKENKLCYHAAYTKCWRMTHSFVVERHDKDFWLDCIEHIENDY